MPLNPEEMSVLRSLSDPIDQRRRSEFLREAVKRIEEAAPQGGVGAVWRVGAATQREYFDPPDLRQGRVGPRG